MAKLIVRGDPVPAPEPTLEFRLESSPGGAIFLVVRNLTDNMENYILVINQDGLLARPRFVNIDGLQTDRDGRVLFDGEASGQ